MFSTPTHTETVLYFSKMLIYPTTNTKYITLGSYDREGGRESGGGDKDGERKVRTICHQ